MSSRKHSAFTDRALPGDTEPRNPNSLANNGDYPVLS